MMYVRPQSTSGYAEGASVMYLSYLAIVVLSEHFCCDLVYSMFVCLQVTLF